ncbi:MAG: protein kinase [Planctomycetaceae bacterium]
MDPPSPQLVARLTGSGLCRHRDLRRSRARVRRLARDVPAFESVWLDALVQSRVLTAFQADVLNSDTPERLNVGPFLLVETAGDDGRFVHYRARRRDSAAAFLLSRPHVEPEIPVAGEERLRMYCDRTAHLTHPGVALPHGYERVDGRLWIASPWTAGSSLQELLVRRGRFAPHFAAAIGLQLCDALASLESADAPHGDVRLRNVRLSPRGQAVLIAAGLRWALFPERSIHADTPPDDADGAAPELIGTGRPTTSASEAYALGCLLWELLAGRPPFPHGDPLAKLAAHQTQQVPDVRDFAPDAPLPLATLVARLTDRDPVLRPQSFRETADALQRIPRASRRQLMQLARGQLPPAAIHRVEEDVPRSAPPALAIGVLLAAIGGVMAINTGVPHNLLSISRPASSAAREQDGPSVASASPPANTPATEPQSQVLPQPDLHGVIELAGPGPYTPREIRVAGKLEIRGAGQDPALILIDEQSWSVAADQLVLANVEIGLRDAAAGTDKPQALVEVQVQQLAVRRCRINAHNSRRPALQWTSPDAESAIPRNCLVIDSVIAGGGPALRAYRPSSVTFDNVLHAPASALVEIVAGDRPPPVMEVTARRVTTRGAVPLVTIRCRDRERFTSAVTLTLENTVCALEQAALLEFLGPEAPTDWQRSLRITGESSLVPPGAVIAGIRTSDARLRPLPVEDVSIEGLMSADLTFAGPADGDPVGSILRGKSGYARSAHPPGIDTARLPAPPAETYNSTTVPRPSK